MRSLLLAAWMFGVFGLPVAWSAPGLGDAGSKGSLVAMVRGFYVPYMAGDKGPEPPAATAVIAAHATAHLKGLIAADEACEKRGQGVCNLDFDVIINGQDWTLTKLPDFSVRAQGAGRAAVVSRFVNDGTTEEVVFEFVRTRGAWLIDDVTGHDAEDGGWRLTSVLSREPG
jgi:hypothetical protein